MLTYVYYLDKVTLVREVDQLHYSLIAYLYNDIQSKV